MFPPELLCCCEEAASCVDTAPLLAWIKERYAIKLKRDAGLPFPWSADPIFQQTFFCNVHREDDKVTRWVRENWRDPHADDPDLWFALLVARRCINNPAAMAELGYPVPWDPDNYVKVYNRRNADVDTGIKGGPGMYRMWAYKTLAGGAKSGRLVDLHNEQILNPAWARHEYFRPRSGDTLWDFHDRLCELKYVSGFYAMQVVCDLKFAQLKDASDWWDYAPSGIGSRRGMARVLGLGDQIRRSDQHSKRWPGRTFTGTSGPDIDEGTFANVLRTIRWVLDPQVEAAGIPRLDASDMQGVLCEYDKYARIQTGLSPGRRFKPQL